MGTSSASMVAGSRIKSYALNSFALRYLSTVPRSSMNVVSPVGSSFWLSLRAFVESWMSHEDHGCFLVISPFSLYPTRFAQPSIARVVRAWIRGSVTTEPTRTGLPLAHALQAHPYP